jgi:hypothetical protein
MDGTALDCDHNQLQTLPRDILHLRKNACLRVLRAIDNPLRPESIEDLLGSSQPLFCDNYRTPLWSSCTLAINPLTSLRAVDGQERSEVDNSAGLSISLFLHALASQDQLQTIPDLGYYDLRSSYSHHSSVSQLQVYRQWYRFFLSPSSHR